MDEEPAFGDALDFKLASDLSPSNQFMAAIMWSLYETFQFLFCFLSLLKSRLKLVLLQFSMGY